MNTNPLVKIIGWLFTLASLLYMFFLLNKNIDNVLINLIDNLNTISILIGFLLYFVLLLNSAPPFYFLVKQKYSIIKFLQVLKIIGQSQIGKYLPGNFGHLIGRVYLSNKIGVTVKDASKFLLIESLALIYSGCLLTLVGTYYYFEFKQISVNKDMILFIFFLLNFTLLFYFFKVRNYSEKSISIKTALILLSFNFISFCILGLILFILSLNFSIEYPPNILHFISAISLAFIAGFIVPGSSAGVGVRETVFVLFMSPSIHESQALSLILLFRLISVVGDLFFYFITIKMNNTREIL